MLKRSIYLINVAKCMGNVLLWEKKFGPLKINLYIIGKKKKKLISEHPLSPRPKNTYSLYYFGDWWRKTRGWAGNRSDLGMVTLISSSQVARRSSDIAYFDTSSSWKVHLKKDFQCSRQKLTNCLKVATNTELRGGIHPKWTLLNKRFPVERPKRFVLI